MENKNITAVIILDLLAAFDTVDHNILLQIQDKKFGIKRKALHWYEQYIKPRRFKVCINNSARLFSHVKGINIGRHLLTFLDGTLVAAVVDRTSPGATQSWSQHQIFPYNNMRHFESF